jgi:phosphate acetyltransferase
MKFIDSVMEKLRRHPKRIVIPEGKEPRILRAAQEFAHLKLGSPILLGTKDEILETARQERVKADHMMIIDPENASDLPAFCSHLEKLDRYKRMGVKNSRDVMVKPNYFAAMMVQYGHADGVVGGVSLFAGSLLRPLIQLIKPLPGVETIASCLIVELKDKRFGEDGVMFLADCGVVPEPTVHQLANIAVRTGALARQLYGLVPRVALLSFSTKGSSTVPQAEKVRAATALAQQRAREEGKEMEIDGELQAGAALCPDVAKQKAPNSLVAGKANVLIFPDLNSGNITSKFIAHLFGAETYGSILLGLSRPAADVSRTATVNQILGAAAVVGLQAIEYRKLYGHDPAVPAAAK